jgi:hypothetical protein
MPGLLAAFSTALLPAAAAACGVSRGGHQPSVPPRFCDNRVQVLQADARLLTPDVLQRYTSNVSSRCACAAHAWRADVGTWPGTLCLSVSMRCPRAPPPPPLHTHTHTHTNTHVCLCHAAPAHTRNARRALTSSCRTCCSSPTASTTWSCRWSWPAPRSTSPQVCVVGCVAAARV